MKGLVEKTRLTECDGRAVLPCVEEVTLAFSDFCKDMGFSWLSFSERPLVRHGGANSAAFISTTFPSLWVERYIEKAYGSIDPVVRCAEFSSPLYGVFGTWEEVKQLCLQRPIGGDRQAQIKYEKSMHRFFEDAFEHGLKSGVIIVEEVEGSLVTVSLAADHFVTMSDKQWRELKVGILLAAREYGKTKGCGTCGRADGRVTLSRMESLMVAAVLGNKNATIEELACMTNRSPETVKHHLKNVRAKVNMKHADRLAVARRCAELRIIPAAPPFQS